MTGAVKMVTLFSSVQAGNQEGKGGWARRSQALKLTSVGGWARRSQANKLAVKRFADQQALDVFPVLGHARRFSVIGQKTVDRFTLIKFYDVSKRLLEEDKVPFRSGHME